MAASASIDSESVHSGDRIISNELFTKWDAIEVKNWLIFQGLSDNVADIFEEQKISGELLSPKYFWNHDKLIRMGIDNEGDRQLCLDSIEELRKELQNHKSKTFQDSLYGSVELHPLLVKIIDTPQFQRLRDIKQLGGVYYVFPGASHNRFEHSIGVCHLAGIFVESLKRNQPELDINDCDVLCIKIAALCHDMGCGPLSSFFQELFIPEIYNGMHWKHEETSVKLMDHMIEVNDELHDMLKIYGLSWEHERSFIHELILGLPLKEAKGFQGRTKPKHFLYEILANKSSFIDVDKIDSLLRDAQSLGISVHFDWERYICNARVVRDSESGISHICPRDKELREVYEFCNFRDYLFQAAYQHRTKRAVELMILEVLKAVNDHIRIPGKGGNFLKISECIGDMEAFTRLTDSILHTITIYTVPYDDEDSTAANDLLKARTILDDISHRRLYMFVGSLSVLESKHKTLIYELDFQKLITDKCMENNPDVVPETDKILPELVKFDYGFSKKNTIDQMWFYQRAFPNKPVTMRKKVIPRKVEQWEIRVYYTDYDSDIRDAARTAFYQICESEGFTGLFEDVQQQATPPASTSSGKGNSRGSQQSNGLSTVPASHRGSMAVLALPGGNRKESCCIS